MRHLLIAHLLSPLLLSLMALGAEKPATCGLASKSIVSRSAAGVAQVSNLGEIEIRCSVPARPFPIKPGGEGRYGLKARTTAYKISVDGSKELVGSEVNLVGGGFDAQQEWVLFYFHIPLESAELDAEARRLLDSMQNALAKEKSSIQPVPLTEDTLQGVRELIYQHQVGHFLVECRVLDKDRVLGVGVVEVEVLFQGRFSDAGVPAVPPRKAGV